jgi:hypothetical protein
MSTPLPAHLVAGISQRIAWLREAWQVDVVYAQPRLADYPIARRGRPTNPGNATPTFPRPHSNDARSRS